jgi:TonB family protein
LKLLLPLSISILIHIGIYFLLIDSNFTFTQSKSTQNTTKQKTNIQYVKLKQEIQKNNIIKPQIEPIQKPITKPKLLEQPKKQKPIIEKKQESKSVKKPKPKKTIPTIPPKIIEPLPPINPQEQEYKKLQKNIKPLTKEYLDHYEDFEKLPTETKLFIIKNIDDIGAITQRYLFYPQMSAQAGQDGVNVVEFMLFENGNISEPKIVKSSNYFLLDDNTIETIKEAYIDYPRPQKPTPIRIFVKYKLIRE